MSSKLIVGHASKYEEGIKNKVFLIYFLNIIYAHTNI